VAIGTGENAQAEGDVADAAGERAGVHPSHQRRRPVTGQWHSAVGRLQSHHAAAMRGVADGAAHVAAEPERRQPGGERGPLAARRAARDAVQVPRVARATEDQVVGLPPQRELGQVRLAEEDPARAPQTRHRGGIGAGHVIGEELRAA
jgi:hypothetical protein